LNRYYHFLGEILWKFAYGIPHVLLEELADATLFPQMANRRRCRVPTQLHSTERKPSPAPYVIAAGVAQVIIGVA
jgi:hypothetical protein